MSICPAKEHCSHVQQRYAQAAALIQAIVGYEWLISGANKVLSGQFPQGLAGRLADGIKDNPNGWDVSFLQALVLPHSVFFGYLIEVTEVGVGLALLGGALLLIGQIPTRGEPYYRLARFEIGVAALAAFACVLLCVNFHFFMGDGFVSALNPGAPFDEGIDLDTLLPPISAILCVLNTRLLIWLIGDEVVRGWLSRLARLRIGVQLAARQVSLGGQQMAGTEMPGQRCRDRDDRSTGSGGGAEGVAQRAQGLPRIKRRAHAAGRFTMPQAWTKAPGWERTPT